MSSSVFMLPVTVNLGKLPSGGQVDHLKAESEIQPISK